MEGGELADAEDEENPPKGLILNLTTERYGNR